MTFSPMHVKPFTRERWLTLDGAEPWSQTCQTAPACIFAPASAEEVAGGLAILRSANQTFAVRTQGHMPIPGAADTSDGVLMVTTSMNSVQFADDSKSVIQIGAGNQWLDVYEVLAKEGLAVAGGRFGPVGVSGLLLGGGISYFSSGMSTTNHSHHESN
jgi:FAD/FMN-containing dehydrogenase